VRAPGKVLYSRTSDSSAAFYLYLFPLDLQLPLITLVPVLCSRASRRGGITLNPFLSCAALSRDEIGGAQNHRVLDSILLRSLRCLIQFKNTSLPRGVRMAEGSLPNRGSSSGRFQALLLHFYPTAGSHVFRKVKQTPPKDCWLLST